MTDSTDDVDWYDGPEQDYECVNCERLELALKAARERLAEVKVRVELITAYSDMGDQLSVKYALEAWCDFLSASQTEP